MRNSSRLALGLLFAPALIAAAPDHGPHCTCAQCHPFDERDAMRVAESDTGGTAVSVHRTRLAGANVAFEVFVKTDDPRGDWKVIVDADTRGVHSKTRVPR